MAAAPRSCLADDGPLRGGGKGPGRRAGIAAGARWAGVVAEELAIEVVSLGVPGPSGDAAGEEVVGGEVGGAADFGAQVGEVVRGGVGAGGDAVVHLDPECLELA